MRDLTKDEITEYLRFAMSDKQAMGYSREQALSIRDGFFESGLAMAVAKCIMEAYDARGGDGKPEDVMLSVWVAAFQMGRECESRLRSRSR